VNSFVSVPLCVIAWIFTFVRLKAILKQGLRDAGDVTLNIWGMSFFFSISVTFIFAEFIAFFDAHTFPSLSLLITNSAFLISQYFGMAGIIAGMEIPTGQQITRWVRMLLGLELTVLLVLYIFFVSKVQATSFFVPQSIPEVVFIAIVSFFAIGMCTLLVATHLVYFPAKKFTLMRLRTLLMILCVSTSGIFLFLRVITFASYIWPFLMFPALVPLSYALLICTTLLFFSVFLSNRLYARFVVLSKSIESWRAFQDLKYLVDRLLLLCPLVALPTNNPPFWKFLSNPEYYLYRAVVIILDGQTMLADFLSEPTMPGEPAFWEDGMLREAVRVNQALQFVHQSSEFYEIVDAYRRVSQELFKGQNYAL
jgi:hypothetical protein